LYIWTIVNNNGIIKNMNRISTYEFRDDLAKYLDLVVSSEKPLIIERRGNPVAVLSPYRGEKADYDCFYGFLCGDETGEKYVNKLRRNKKEAEKIKKYKKR
jgi:prevent-host-death family protein